MFYSWKPYVPVAKRRLAAKRQMDRLAKQGHAGSPVVIEGRAIATTVWGKAWCTNLERYSDFDNRLPRGRTYVRNGSVVDLQVAPGRVTARVAGSSLYRVDVTVTRMPKGQWAALCAECSHGIDSLVELLQGRVSKGVMEHICKPGSGLFPAPQQLRFDCSCPDWANMCKHVAAVLYGVGARLDHQPELLFELRQVDQQELVARARRGQPLAKSGLARERVLDDKLAAALFGIEIAEPGVVPVSGAPAVASKASRSSRAAGAAAAKPGRARMESAQKPAAKPTQQAAKRRRAVAAVRTNLANAKPSAPARSPNPTDEVADPQARGRANQLRPARLTPASRDLPAGAVRGRRTRSDPRSA